MNNIIEQLDFDKVNGLVPCIIQDVDSNKVLMLGYMNQAAIEKTVSSKKVTFFSRTKKRLWTKGETSGNYLILKDILVDCDRDSLLVKVSPTGPVCHKGTDTCFNETNNKPFDLAYLENVIESRKSMDSNVSYVASLFDKGINKIAQKVGEEAVEMVIESKDNNDDLFLNEGADLLFHYLILLNAKGFNLTDINNILKERHKK